MGAIIQSTMQVRGLAELVESLGEFGEAIAKKHLLRATFSSSSKVLELARQKAPRGTGTRKDSRGAGIGHLADDLWQNKAKSKNGEVRYVIGSDEHGPLLHLVEFGTRPHWQPRSRRQHPGAVAKPFLRPAIDEGGGDAIAEFAKVILEGVYAEGAKAAKKTKRLSRYLTTIGTGIQRSGVRL